MSRFTAIKNCTIVLPDFEELARFDLGGKVYVTIRGVDRAKKIVHYTWDCGMDGEAEIGSFLHIDIKGIRDTVIANCQFNLAHAFFHPSEDPNYTYYHWALWGIYRDKIVTAEEWDKI